ncbi:hypothetical protein [Thiorhodococcus minor]|uniref:Glycosyltransferase RgtA/B/C/D-like domain-containing protein n=1 Tax=Thiorhodococcus minor TaxID=57489 RepID=A0A6M0K128_9GAMM|nr:hypothetical protein [Thiorhodococcus minor]NEV63014.1 hypothetical protein [Thiorhodococcus minor]
MKWQRLSANFSLALLICAAFILFIAAQVPENTLLKYPGLVNLWLVIEQDPAWLIIAGSLGLALTPLLRVGRLVERLDKFRSWATARQHPVTLLAIAVSLIAAIGVDWVYHRFALSLDEFLLVWQAKVFLAGHLIAPIPEGWSTLARALQPIFMYYDFVNGFWSPAYRPLSAGIYALFDLAHLGPWSNALLAGGSVALTAAIARRTWPQESTAPGFTALFVATSPQLLITAMTPYAMTGHLFLNLLWLWLFLADTRNKHLLAGLVGLLACGLHQIYVHPLFIAPFMTSLLWQKRWRLAAGYAAWYAAVLLLWIYWRDLATFLAQGDSFGLSDTLNTVSASGSSLFRQVFTLADGPNAGETIAILFNLARFVAWQNPLTVLLAVVGWLGLGRAPHLIRMLSWSLVLTVLAHVILMPLQGHGWGYRYLHVHLGSLALIGAWGWLRLRDTMPDRDRISFKNAGAVLALATLLVAVPLRAWQTETFVRPFATADRAIQGRSEDIVVIDASDIWFGVDLVRNDPFLRNHPRILVAQRIQRESLEAVCADSRWVLIDYPSVARFGLRQMPEPQHTGAQTPMTLRAQLAQAGCDSVTGIADSAPPDCEAISCLRP